MQSVRTGGHLHLDSEAVEGVWGAPPRAAPFGVEELEVVCEPIDAGSLGAGNPARFDLRTYELGLTGNALAEADRSAQEPPASSVNKISTSSERRSSHQTR